jgi:hypothetical protein
MVERLAEKLVGN